MSQFTLSLFDPNFLLPHRAGVAGLALALAELENQGNHAPLTWNITDEAVELEWEDSDQEVVTWLLKQTYQINDQGYLNVPALKLDEQGQYTFTQGVLTTFLQHNKHRKLKSPSVTRTFSIDEGQPEIQIDVKPLLSCYYTSDLKDAFNNKGAFKKKIPLKGNHLPGLVECFVNGPYQESPQGFLALLFLPLACGYYQLPPQPVGGKLSARSALVIPEVQHLKHWVRRRRAMRGCTYRDFRSSGAGESALHFLLQEKAIEESQQFGVHYCEVYQLGKQVWNAQQAYLKQAVYRVEVTDKVLKVLKLYEEARQVFPACVRQKENGETWLALSKALPWICDNLIGGQPWYAGFFEFYKRNRIYEREGLVKMAEYLNLDERVLFEVVQDAFSKYLDGQRQQANEQGRKLDYGQVTDKVIYRFQRPNTQQEFATALVDFLSQFRSKAARDKGPQIVHWIHREENWRRARDLVLLAIATYSSKKGDALNGVDVPLESMDEGDTTEEEMFAFANE
ncbi:type I-MYXAN CRISPR-associated Cas8a1/Cmx1 [Thermosynechococcus sichuanensis E542]|uniref:Type I-MYXAN CRISPR-associated Cas8a1/Cmx1 n=1 Tax=Thermosynechococcus sichuanensis E542 TaxID=2016101 RepID=A0A3B7MF93_9CYAN|nr:type I-MYXAN CRISPR-associated Cas8a1/Cmx1 [Thermosynechococcus vestitus]AXY68308.1 type I-MYXAN CRISPR-associated Cas8a1/Cmx1 [Thermosynechococcus vestitus E542]